MLKDSVIRFGGNSCSNKILFKSLVLNLQKNEGKVYLVVSADARIYNLINEQLVHVFRVGIQSNYLKSQFETIFESTVRRKPSSLYQSYVTKVILLLDGISLTGDFSVSLKDQVLSYSEKLTAVILQELLDQKKIDSEVLLPEQNGFKVSSDFGNAAHTYFDFNSIASVNDSSIFIIPGSYGITEDGKIARAGNSAADYTAAAISAWLHVPELVLWGLEKDFKSADPEIVSNPTKIKRLTYAEASELAYFDNYSFHPRTVEPLELLDLPIHVVSFNEGKAEVETIINADTYVSKTIVKAVAHSDDVSLLKFDGAGVGLKPGILAKVTSALHNAGINIRSVITAQTSINFLLTEEDGKKALQLVNELGFTTVKDISLVSDVSLIGVIGNGLQQNYGVFAKLFGAVAESQINVLLSGSGASDLVSYLVVKQKDRDKGVKVIHKAFFEKQSSPENVKVFV